MSFKLSYKLFYLYVAINEDNVLTPTRKILISKVEGEF